jgi:uncharacterized glyoxalase superfamily protein PhnB
MTDPFEALRQPQTIPVDPDPDFTERLRRRLTREVFASPGGAMSQPTAAQPAAAQPAATATSQIDRQPAWPPALTPYIVVSDARQAMDWYADVFGAQRRGDLHVNADGTIGHAEIGIDDAVLMLSEVSDLWPDVPVQAPASPTKFSHTLHLQVDDVDGTTERARSIGATVEREPIDQPYGRGSVIIDPFGHRWMLLRPPSTATRLRQGDLAHVTMRVPDADRAKDFYEAVLRVPFAAGHPGAWRSDAVRPPVGIISARDDDDPQVQVSFRVDDVTATIERILAAGGHADEPRHMPYGLLAQCVDDQGATFHLWQPV